MTATLIMAAVAGTAIGMLYFGLLWRATRAFTVTGGYSAFMLAALARLALIPAGIMLVLTLGGGLPELAGAALGFIAARVVIVRALSREPGEG